MVENLVNDRERVNHFHCIFTSSPVPPTNMMFVQLNHFQIPLHMFSNRLILPFKTEPNPLIMRSGRRSEPRMPLHMAGQIRVSPAVWISNSAAAGLHLSPELQLNASRCASRSAWPCGAYTETLQLGEQHETSMQSAWDQWDTTCGKHLWINHVKAEVK